MCGLFFGVSGCGDGVMGWEGKNNFRKLLTGSAIRDNLVAHLTKV